MLEMRFRGFTIRQRMGDGRGSIIIKDDKLGFVDRIEIAHWVVAEAKRRPA